ncbi:MAG: phosphate ABC transporter permease subunit PstC [Clostridia bacterium]|nr:phosphate ABC transporter permease subunit PstC [Clostridia bacterium]
MKSLYGYINAREKVMKGVFIGSALFSVFALLSITVFLFWSGVPFIAKIGVGDFIFGTKWAPLADSPSYGILSMIVTTLYVTALSVILGVGIGLFTAICLYKFCPKKLVSPIRQMINLLAGIPSVIFGLFGMTLIVPFIRDYVSPTGVGYGILSASIVLAIMILPTIVSVSLDAMVSVPNTYFEGALALGATKEQTTFKVMLPAAKSGILAGVVLAIGRAIGETMAVIMVIGGSPEMPNSIFQSVRTMTANIAMGATELSGDALSALIATGVVLFVFTLLLNVSFSALKNNSVKKDRKKNKEKRYAKNK